MIIKKVVISNKYPAFSIFYNFIEQVWKIIIYFLIKFWCKIANDGFINLRVLQEKTSDKIFSLQPLSKTTQNLYVLYFKIQNKNEST